MGSPRQFLYMSAEGYAATAALDDLMSLSQLSISPSGGVAGVGIDMNSSRIINLNDPTGAKDAANKQYVDSVATGLNVKSPVRVVAVAAVTIASPGATIDGVTMVAGDRVLLTNQTPANANGIYVWNGAATPMTRAPDADSSAEVHPGMYVFVSEGSAAWMNTSWVLTTDDPITLGTTNLTFVQFAGQLNLLPGAGLALNGNALDVGAGDGITVSTDTVAANIDTNAGLQFDASSPKKIQVKASTGITVGAAGVAVSLTAGAGTSSANATTTVKAGDGIEVTSNGASVNVAPQALSSTTGGLILVGSAGSKLLGVGAGWGIGFSDGSAGTTGYLIPKLNGTTLALASGGLSVLGVPAAGTWTIGGVATSANVTAPNLGTLTAGSSSNADALHTHAETQSVKVPLVAAGAIAKGDGVYISTNDKVAKGANNVDASARIIGVADAAISDLATGKIAMDGAIVTGILSGATAGTRYFLGLTGQPVLVGTLAAGARTVQLGIAKNATDMLVQVVDYGKRA